MSEDQKLGTFDIGALLAKAREEKGVSLNSASVQTNLSVSVLEKLESNRFAEIGALVFARGYLLKYVRFLGLDESRILEAFAKLNHRSTEVQFSSANVASQSHSYRRYHYKTWAVLSLFFVVIALILWQVLDNRSWLMSQVENAFQEGNQEDTPVLAMPDIEVLHEEVAFPEPVEVIAPVEALTLSSLEGELGLDEAFQQDFLDDAATLDASEEENQNLWQLVVRGESWLEVRDKDGRVLLSRIMESGTVDLPIEEAPFSLNIGRPENVGLLVDGQERDLAVYRIGNSRRYKVDMNHE